MNRIAERFLSLNCQGKRTGEHWDSANCERGEMEKTYVLNSPILTSWGRFEFWRITKNETEQILQCTPFVSAIGHEGTASLLSRLLSVNVPANRIQIKMNVGDRAIVFWLLERQPEGKILTEEELLHLQYEFGLLKRLPDKEPEPSILSPRAWRNLAREADPEGII